MYIKLPKAAYFFKYICKKIFGIIRKKTEGESYGSKKTNIINRK